MEKIELIESGDTAEILHISKITLYRKIKNKEIEYYKPGKKYLFSMENIKKFLINEKRKNHICEKNKNEKEN